jgi:hypothetical protein
MLKLYGFSKVNAGSQAVGEGPREQGSWWRPLNVTVTASTTAWEA